MGIFSWFTKKQGKPAPSISQPKIPEALRDILLEELRKTDYFSAEGYDSLLRYFAEGKKNKTEKENLFSYIAATEDVSTLKKRNALIDNIYHRARAKLNMRESYSKLVASGAEKFKVTTIDDYRRCAWCKKCHGKKFNISVNFPRLWEEKCTCTPYSLTHTVIQIKGVDY